MRNKLLALSVLLVATVYLAANYVIYYDCTHDYKTSILVSNLSDEKAYFRVTVYDSSGQKLWRESYNRPPYGSVFIDLSNVVSQAESSWGLVLIQCEQLLHVTALYYEAEGTLLNSNHIIEPLNFLEDAKYYWYSAGYVNAQESQPSLILVNPNENTIDVVLWIYDESGQLVEDLEGEIEPFAAAYVNLMKYLQQGSGIVDVRTTMPILLAVEWYEDGLLWNINNIVDWYTTTSW
ncbi:MAG: hypothetical protein H5T93_07590 [Pseudothermotoga sp.]|uniref:hypothetical protein n=1 Tax=Pseudothermotoga sp. TaxID=2033661 RepID=UPI000E961106|nr:hypothetical protein [Pseudothermotoga sp.]HBT39045.1 hypothetical protein [Pseudothermotoga sp.]